LTAANNLPVDTPPFPLNTTFKYNSIKDAVMPELLNKKAALQFWDAVEQFKLHYPYREKAKKAADQGSWYDAFLNEEMAWQYLVKCASRGIFAKKIVDGE